MLLPEFSISPSGYYAKASWIRHFFEKSSCESFHQHHVVTNITVTLSGAKQDPDGEIENSVKSIFEIRIPNFSYIQVIVFDLSYLPVAAVGT